MCIRDSHDPVRLFENPFAEPEGFEDLHCAALQAIGVALLQWTGSGFDDSCRYVWKLSQLGTEKLACWTGANNQDIDFGWKGCLEVGFLSASELICERIVASIEAVEVVLHGLDQLSRRR